MFKFYLGTDSLTGKPLTTTRRGFKSRKEAQDAMKQLQLEVYSAHIKNNNMKRIKIFITCGLSSTKTALKKVHL